MYNPIGVSWHRIFHGKVNCGSQCRIILKWKTDAKVYFYIFTYMPKNFIFGIHTGLYAIQAPTRKSGAGNDYAWEEIPCQRGMNYQGIFAYNWNTWHSDGNTHIISDIVTETDTIPIYMCQKYGVAGCCFCSHED